jgi:hypothetical protein
MLASNFEEPEENGSFGRRALTEHHYRGHDRRLDDREHAEHDDLGQ